MKLQNKLELKEFGGQNEKTLDLVYNSKLSQSPGILDTLSIN